MIPQPDYLFNLFMRHNTRFHFAFFILHFAFSNEFCRLFFFDQALQGRDILFGHARGDLILLQTFETLAGFIQGSADVFVSTVRKEGHDNPSIQFRRFLQRPPHRSA